MSDEEDLIEIRFTVEPNRRGWRLDRYLQMKIKRLSRTRIAEVIRESVTVGGERARKPGIRLKVGDAILIRRVAPPEPEVDTDFRVLARGRGFVAVDKPAGLPIHPTARYYRNTLTSAVRARFGADCGINPAHRIDRETSGVVLLGEGVEATKRLKAAFQAGEVKKRYLALARGDLAEARVIDEPLGSAIDSEIRIKMGVRPDGYPSCTRVTPRRRFGRYTLVEAEPVTGRTHQIRAHLDAIGHPIVGDKIYGQPDSVFLAWLEDGLTPEILAKLELPRHALHAARLDFPLPDGPGRYAVEAPLHPDMQGFLDQL